MQGNGLVPPVQVEGDEMLPGIVSDHGAHKFDNLAGITDRAGGIGMGGSFAHKRELDPSERDAATGRVYSASQRSLLVVLGGCVGRRWCYRTVGARFVSTSSDRLGVRIVSRFHVTQLANNAHVLTIGDRAPCR